MLIRNAVRAFFLLSLSLLHLSLAAAGRELAPRGIAESSYYTYGVTTAWAGERFLTLWHEQMGELGYVTRGAFSDADGKRVSTQSFPVGVPALDVMVQLVGNGDGYTLFHVAAGRTMFMTDLDLQGRVTATRPVNLPVHPFQRIVWNGTAFAIAASDIGRNTTTLHLLDRSGQPLRDPIALSGGGTGSDITAIGNSLVVLAAGDGGLYAHGVRADGTVDRYLLEPSFDGPSGTRNRPFGVAVTDVPNGALAVWGVQYGSEMQLRAHLLERTGQPIDDQHQAHFLVGGPGFFTPLDVMRTAGGYVVTYRYASSGGAEASLHAIRLAPDGRLLGAPQTLISLPPFDISTASNGRVTLVAWQPEYRIAPFVRSSAVNAALAVHEEILSLSPTRQLQPALVATAGRFLASWTELAGSSAAVRLASVAVDGAPLPTGYLPAHPQSTYSPRLASRELASNDTQTLVLQYTGNALLGTRVWFDGSVIDEIPHTIGTIKAAPNAAAAWVRDRWVIVWPAAHDGQSLQFATMSAEGVVSAAQTLALPVEVEPDQDRVHEFATLESDGRNAILVWAERHRPICYFPICEEGSMHTFATRLSPGGTVLDAPVALSRGELRGVSVATSRRGEYFVALGSTGYLLDVRGALRVASSRELFTWPAASDVTWDGREYVVAMRYRALNWYLATRRFDRGGREIGSIRGTQTLAADEFVPPSVASAMQNESMIAVQEGDVVDGVRAVVYRERDFAPLPAPPQSPQNVRVRSIPQGLLEVTWDAVEGAEAYVVEIRDGDFWIPIVTTRPDDRRAFVGPSTVRVRAFNAGGGSPATDPVTSSPAPRRRSVGR
jgi:hypothetical protein